MGEKSIIMWFSCHVLRIHLRRGRSGREIIIFMKKYIHDKINLWCVIILLTHSTSLQSSTWFITIYNIDISN